MKPPRTARPSLKSGSIGAEVEAAVLGEEEPDVSGHEDGVGRGADDAVDAVVGERRWRAVRRPCGPRWRRRQWT